MYDLRRDIIMLDAPMSDYGRDILGMSKALDFYIPTDNSALEQFVLYYYYYCLEFSYE